MKLCLKVVLSCFSTIDLPSLKEIELGNYALQGSSESSRKQITKEPYNLMNSISFKSWNIDLMWM